MTPEEYRIRRRELDTRSKYLPHKDQIIEAIMGLTSESGEAQQLINKHFYNGQALFSGDLLNELGDVIWYLDALLCASKFTLYDLFEVNIDKLERRAYKTISSQELQEKGYLDETLPTEEV